MRNVLWVISIILMWMFSFSAYPDVVKVRYPKFKTQSTPQPQEPKRVKSLFPPIQKEKNLMDEIEKSREKKEVASNECE